MYTFLLVFLLFFIYSVVGWVIEMLFVFAVSGKTANRGFLIGPYCPIYGFGALTMLFALYQANYNPFLFFVFFIGYAGLLEYFTSFLLERLFNARWWDYSKAKFNLNGRVCLEKSILFGLLGIFGAFVLNPTVMQFVLALPNMALYFMATVAALIMLLDLIITLKVVQNLRRNIKLLNIDMLEEFKENFSAILKKKRFIKASPMIARKIQNLLNKERSS